MLGSPHTRRIEAVLVVAVVVAVAVGGIYDFTTGLAPVSRVPINADLGFALFLVGLAATGGVALAALFSDQHWPRPIVRAALVAVALTPALFGDPTYASLVVTIPLIDIRRRDAEPTRTLWMLAVAAAVAALVFFEDSPQAVNEEEVMLGLGIAFLLVVLLGDALRALDRGLAAERELAQLTERSHPAEELHDSLGHHLLASSMQLRKANVIRDKDPLRAAEATDRAAEAVALAIAETRLIVDTTRLEDGFEIEPSIQGLAQRIVPPGTQLKVAISGDHGRLGLSARMAIYRVVQESLTNLVRHSAATVASIKSIANEDSVTIEIVDNGAGFDPVSKRAAGGLANMRRRVEDLGGEFGVVSTVEGTSITATVPQ